MKRQKVMSQIKGQDKTPGKQLNEVEKEPARKRIQNNDSEDDPGSWENNGEDARNLYQRTRRMKNKQVEMNDTLEGINSKLTKAEEWKEKKRQPKEPLGQH